VPESVESREVRYVVPQLRPEMYSPGKHTWEEAIWPKQKIFHQSQAKNRLQIGSYGSGKSKPLLWEAIFHCIEFPGCDCVILRKTVPDLKRTVISRFEEIQPRPPHPEAIYQSYNKSDKIVYFHPHPVTGAQSKLHFAACEREEDVGKFLSTEWLYIGFEELGEFSFPIWDAMAGRNRCPIPGSRPCMAGATNPMGIGWSWIKKLWVDGECVHKVKRNQLCLECGGPAEIDTRRTVSLLGIDPERFNPKDYVFFHSTVDDNPVLFADKEYVARLEASPNRERIRWGKLDAVSGQYFDNWEPSRHIRKVTDFLFQPWQTFVIGWDYGFGHFATMLWLTKAILKPRWAGEAARMVNVFTRELYLHENTPKQQAEAVIMSIPRDKEGNALETVDHVYFSWERFIRTQGDFTISDEVGDLLAAQGLPRPSRSNTDRVAGWTKMYSLLDTDDLFVLDCCPILAEAIPLLVRDDKNIEDVKKPKGMSLNDDIADGARYAIAGSLLDAEDVPADVLFREKLGKVQDPMAKAVMAFENYNKEMAKQRQGPKPMSLPTWASKLRMQ
jgi:hypothetical protein